MRPTGLWILWVGLCGALLVPCKPDECSGGTAWEVPLAQALAAQRRADEHRLARGRATGVRQAAGATASRGEESSVQPRRWDEARRDWEAASTATPGARASWFQEGWQWLSGESIHQVSWQEPAVPGAIPVVESPARLTDVLHQQRSQRRGWFHRDRSQGLYSRAREHYESALSGLRDPATHTAPTERLWLYDNIFTGRYAKVMVEPVGERRMAPYFYASTWQFTGDLYEDTMNLYSFDSLVKLSLVTGLSAVLANTQLDQEFQDWFQDDVVGDRDPNYAHWAKVLGEPWLFPAGAAILWGTTELVAANPLSRDGRLREGLRAWSRQTTRAYLVAAPLVYGLQWAIGSSRPGESEDGSSWQPFQDTNGVSAHTAIGAVPFLVLAKYTDKWYWKALFVVASGFAGYSQLYDNSQYLSQVLLGYSLAYLSVEATEATNRSGYGYRLVPLSATGLWGIGIEFRK